MCFCLFSPVMTRGVGPHFLISLGRSFRRSIQLILKEFKFPYHETWIQRNFSTSIAWFKCADADRRNCCIVLNFKRNTQHKDSLSKESFAITHNSALRQLNMISKCPMNYKTEEENIGMKSAGKFMILCINNLPAHQVMCWYIATTNCK